MNSQLCNLFKDTEEFESDDDIEPPTSPTPRTRKVLPRAIRDKIYEFFGADIAARKPPTTIACRQYVTDTASDLDYIKVKAVVNSRIQG